MFPSKYLKAADFEDEEASLRISRVVREKLKEDDPEEKTIVYFEDERRGLVLNMTNGGSIAYMYGDDSKDWIGKDVVLYQEIVPFKGEMKPAIRIRVMKEKKIAHRIGERKIKSSEPEVDEDGYVIR